MVMERMFNPFFTTRATGTGLGLAIVHRIVDAHGGSVSVRNHEDGGAVVEIALPTACGVNGQATNAPAAA
jgi:signal transduction histidine kinase